MLKLPGTIAMHKIGQIASHNTYTNSNWIEHLDHVNAFELDVWPLHNWTVSHAFDVGAGHLEGYMEDLAAWRKQHPDHDLITVFIEIKSKEGWQVPHFESILLKHFKRSDMFRPMDLVNWGQHKASATSLRELVKQDGWPTFEEVKNKIMFVLNNDGDHVTETYLAERPLRDGGSWSNQSGSLPLCFVMSSESDRRPGYENIVIFNGTYDELPNLSQAPDDKCLRRAYEVKSGNDEMASGKPGVATNLITDKWINYLCYDEVDHAFSTNLR